MNGLDATKQFNSEAQLDEFLTRPTQDLVEFLKFRTSDLMILGAGGKMGPSLAVLAKRGFEQAQSRCRVICVSRFSDPSTVNYLKENDVDVISGDLTSLSVLTELPEVRHIVFMAGMKFGSSGAPEKTWQMNVLLPWNIARRFPKATFAVLSTGNVYGFTPPESGGPDESIAPDPVGEYAWTCLGRERMFELAALEMGTKSVRLRLNYATDLRYGVLVDIANKVLSGQEIPLEQGYFNTIWQAEANRIILRSFDYADAPSTVLNISGPETLSVRQTAEAFSNTFGRKAIFSGTESKTALLNNANLSRKLYGTGNNVGADTLIEWTASWLKSGGRLINKPTHFEAKDGKF